RRTFQSITGKPFCPIAAIAAPETFRRARLADENPARVWQCKGRSGGVSGTLTRGTGRTPSTKTPQRGGCSSQNVPHEQPVGHARLEMLEYAGLFSRHADRQRLAVCHPKLDDIGPVALGVDQYSCHHEAYTGRSAWLPLGRARLSAWIEHRSGEQRSPEVLPPAGATVPPWLPAKSARVSNL